MRSFIRRYRSDVFEVMYSVVGAVVDSAVRSFVDWFVKDVELMESIVHAVELAVVILSVKCNV
jgi:hypothetical protein